MGEIIALITHSTSVSRHLPVGYQRAQARASATANKYASFAPPRGAAGFYDAYDDDYGAGSGGGGLNEMGSGIIGGGIGGGYGGGGDYVDGGGGGDGDGDGGIEYAWRAGGGARGERRAVLLGRLGTFFMFVGELKTWHTTGHRRSKACRAVRGARIAILPHCLRVYFIMFAQ